MAKYLLDTHTLLWFLNEDPALSLTARQLIQSQPKMYVSIINLWEIAIKVSINKLSLPTNFEMLFPQQLILNNFQILPLRVEHLYGVLNLPFHHRDPFDRLLISQALFENAVLISKDTKFKDYSITTAW